LGFMLQLNLPSTLFKNQHKTKNKC